MNILDDVLAERGLTWSAEDMALVERIAKRAAVAGVDRATLGATSTTSEAAFAHLTAQLANVTAAAARDAATVLAEATRRYVDAGLKLALHALGIALA